MAEHEHVAVDQRVTDPLTAIDKPCGMDWACTFVYRDTIHGGGWVDLAADLRAERDVLKTEVERLRAGEADVPAARDTWPTPAQWIRLFNDATPERRLEVAERVLTASNEANECFQRDHERKLAAHAADNHRLREFIMAQHENGSFDWSLPTGSWPDVALQLIRRLLADRSALQARIDAATKLHVVDCGQCWHCDYEWPCPTVAALAVGGDPQNGETAG